MGIDYHSGPHHYTPQKSEVDDDTMPTKVQKTDVQLTQSSSTAGTQSSKAASDACANTPSEDTLTSSS